MKSKIAYFTDKSGNAFVSSSRPPSVLGWEGMHESNQVVKKKTRVLLAGFRSHARTPYEPLRRNGSRGSCLFEMYTHMSSSGGTAAAV